MVTFIIYGAIRAVWRMDLHRALRPRSGNRATAAAVMWPETVISAGLCQSNIARGSCQRIPPGILAPTGYDRIRGLHDFPPGAGTPL